MNKNLVRAFFTVCVMLSLAPLANASTHTTHTTSSSSFKSGFSSQKKSSSVTPQNSDAGTSGGNTSFGSFSKNGNAGGTQTSNSALNNNLSNSAANSQALQTLDARNAAKNAAANPYYGSTTQTSQGTISSYGQAPIIIQNHSSSNGWLWFMLGQSMTNHDRTVVINNNANNGQVDNGAVNAEPQNQASFFMKVVRMFFWLMVLSGIAWLLYFLFRRNTATKPRNYSLGKE